MTNDGANNLSDVAWRSYETDLDLYKFYLDLVWKIAGFFFSLAGAIIAYSLRHYPDDRMILLALVLPSLMAAALSILFSKGVTAARILDETHEATSNSLGISNPFDLSFLTDILRFFTWVYGVVALATAALFLYLITAD